MYILRFAALCVALVVVAQDARADYANGIAAFRRGDDATAFAELQAPASQGDARAAFVLGVLYAKGKVVPADAKTAAEWLMRAAEKHFPPAEFGLGNLYFNGLGVPKDDALAALWYMRAAQHGFTPAWINLGLLYAAGHGVPQDRAQAMEYVRKAADAGLPRAQVTLGFLYDVGGTLSPEVLDSLVAAAMGLISMQSFGAKLRESAATTSEADRTEATRWYREAAEHGVVEAQLLLGMRYATGMGTPRDRVQAYKWLALASSEPTARAALRDIEIQMPDAERMEGERLVQEWKRAHLPAPTQSELRSTD